MIYSGLTSVPGAPGNILAGTFGVGGGFDIPQQRKSPAPGSGPQLNPLQQTPARVFPQSQPGREGAIDVRFRQALGGMPGAIGNLAGMANSQFYMGPQKGQMLQGFGNKMVFQ